MYDGCRTPLILNLALGGVPWTLLSRGQSAPYTLNRLVGPQNLYWCFGEELNILPLTGIEPRFLISAFHSVVTKLGEWTVSPYLVNKSAWNIVSLKWKRRCIVWCVYGAIQDYTQFETEMWSPSLIISVWSLTKRYVNWQKLRVFWYRQYVYKAISMYRS